PAAGNARHRQALRIHVGPAHQVVESPDAVPALDPCWRVTCRLPPPAAFAVGAVMDAGNLAELQCVDDEADVSVRGEPHAVVLEGGLVAVAAAPRMATDV